MYTYLQKYKGYTSGSRYNLAPVCREKMNHTGSSVFLGLKNGEFWRDVVFLSFDIYVV